MKAKTWANAGALALMGGILVAPLFGSASADATESSAGDRGAIAPPADGTGAPPPGMNLCLHQAANTFHCIDDTSFQLCTGNDNYVVNSCPKGYCATRHPASKNPCVGAARARQIDGVDPTPPGQ